MLLMKFEYALQLVNGGAGILTKRVWSKFQGPNYHLHQPVDCVGLVAPGPICQCVFMPQCRLHLSYSHSLLGVC